jgi:RNase adapter protein RapZ
MGPDRPLIDGIAGERAMMAPLRDAADETLDTSDLSLHEARRHLSALFQLNADPQLQVFVTSFSYRRGIPREADLVFDVRFLRNPHYQEALRPLSGLDAAVADHIAQDPACADFFAGLTALLMPLLPRYVYEGKRYLTIAIGCTGGRHRSVFVAQALAKWLSERGYRTMTAHRDMGAPSQAAATMMARSGEATQGENA